MPEALFLHAARDARIGPLALPEGKPDQVLLTVAAVGICGSDLHYYKDGGIGSARVTAPFVPGHEFGGWLQADLPELGLRRGALVAVDPNDSCGKCAWCRQGHRNLCPQVRFIGAPPYNGAMTREIWVRRSLVVPLPEGFTPLEAAMLEPLGVAIHAVDLAKPRLAERVILLGSGTIGLSILQLLRLVGVGEIFVVEPAAERRGMAERFGATRTGATLGEALAWSGGEGAPLVIEATNAPAGFSDAVAATRIGGRIVLVGIPDGDTYTLPAAPARRRGLNIKFCRRMGDDYPRAIALIAAGKVDVAALVTHHFTLAEGPEAFRLLADGAPGMIKSIIHP
jgi:L-iditol 2-dehydrogenase